MPLTPFIQNYGRILLDLDGCVWVGRDATPRAQDAVAALREAQIAIAFVTNRVSHTEEDLVRKLWRLGFQASTSEVVTAGAALRHRLGDHAPAGSSAYVIGPQAIVDHVAEAGLRIVNQTDFARRADYVVVAGHERFDYGELRTATQAVLAGAELVAAGRDANYPMPDGSWPGTGAIVAAVEYATGRQAETVGKPSAEIVETALERLAPAEGAVLMVGDSLSADLATAAAAQIDCAIVLTGQADGEAARRASKPAPVLIADTLADVILGV